MKVLALCLAIFATVLVTAPPAFARVDDPMFGVDWRPSICSFEPFDNWICARIFFYAMNQHNAAIDLATDACNGGNYQSCHYAHYEALMNEFVGTSCHEEWQDGYGGEGYPPQEVTTWCAQLYEKIMRDYIPYNDPNCAC